MGKASRAKKERKSLARQLPDLQRKLREQVDLLAALGALFDDGRWVAALPIAVSVRVLVHQTAKSGALLQQLGTLGSLRFVDTAEHINPKNLLPTTGLTMMRMTAGVGADWAAPLDNLAPSRVHPRIPFRTWWTTAVINDRAGNQWSRRDLVLHLANKEGGAHVDPLAPDEALRALEHDNSLGWTFTDPIVGEGVPMRNGPIPPSVRQIGHELHATLAPVAAATGPSPG
jgi:hypothetical protein